MAVCPTCGRDEGDSAYCTHDGTPLAHVGKGPAAMPKAGDDLDGRYKLIEEIGRGGMAMVFVAHAQALDREVALKILYPRWGEDRKTVARFAREARAASQIDHESVVRVYDFGYASTGYYFLAMEKLDGEPLKDLLAREKKLSPGRAMRLLGAVASGMGRAHELGVIHRDLKPENIMVEALPAGDRVTIVDFGLSKIQEADAMLTGEGDVIGTPDFMAPEQWLGQTIDTRVDVYSFGIVAYEMLSGTLPFQGESLIQKLQAHLHIEAKPLAGVVNTPLPAGLSELVEKCMTKDPAERPTTMSWVAAELEKVRDASRAPSLPDASIDGLGSAPMATVMAPTRDAGLDRLGLLTEIRRLTRVRQQRLIALIPRAFESDPPDSVWKLQDGIAASEAALEKAEEALAISEVTLKEAQRAHRTREAVLRSRLVAANLELAVSRDALPSEVTQIADADTVNIDGAYTAPVRDPNEPREAKRALADLHRAEALLAAFVRNPDEAVEEAEALFDRSVAQVETAEAPLGALYAELEDALQQASAADGSALGELSQLEGLITTYRVRVELIDRRAAREA